MVIVAAVERNIQAHILAMHPAARGNIYALSADEVPLLPRTLEQTIERFTRGNLAREFCVEMV